MYEAHLSNHSDAALRAELARIKASSDPAGPIFGCGYLNHGFATRAITAELQSRRGASTPGPGGHSGQSQASRIPEAPAKPDIRSRSFAAQVYTARKAARVKASKRPSGDVADESAQPAAWSALAAKVYAGRRARRLARLGPEED